jgi:hypothetical protein
MPTLSDLLDKTTLLFIIAIIACAILTGLNKLSPDDFLKILLFIIGYVTKTAVDYAKKVR